MKFKQKLNLDKARSLLQGEAKARALRCQKKIAKALAEENCVIEAGVLVTQRGNIPQIQVMAKPGS